MVVCALWRSEAPRAVPWLRPCSRVRLVHDLKPCVPLHNAWATIPNSLTAHLLSIERTIACNQADWLKLHGKLMHVTLKVGNGNSGKISGKSLCLEFVIYQHFS